MKGGECRCLQVRLLVYLIMALAFMFFCPGRLSPNRENPESNRPWLIAAPALLLTVALLAVMVDDLLS